MPRYGVLTSGGDAPGMNAAIRSVIRCGIDRGFEMYGIYRGYEGLLEGDIKRMYGEDVADIMQRGGTILKTARSQEFTTDEGLDKAVNIIETFDLDGLVVIGGDGSLHGALALANRGIAVVGLPGTIDNDLGYTDFTIGFDTAVNTVIRGISSIRDTSSSHERTTIIQVMGRGCGDIALYSAVAGGAERVLIPEIPVDIDDVCKKIIIDANNGKTHSIIVVAEGAEIKGPELVEVIKSRTMKESRMVVLSYLQRGGSPTLRDRLLATRCGARAIEVLANYTGPKAIGEIGGQIIGVDLEEALRQKREVDLDLYNLVEVLSK